MTVTASITTEASRPALSPIDTGMMADHDRLKTAKIAQIESILLTYPLFDSLLAEIDHCRIHSKVSAEPLCMLIGGETGSGKTTLQRCYGETVTRKFQGEQIPVLLVRAPPRGTEKKLVTVMLRSIGDPGAQFGSVDVQTARLNNLMNDFNVEIVLIDEFQQFVDRDNFRVLQNQCDWVKDLIDISRRAFIFCGMPWAVNILERPENQQLSRRIPIRRLLAPFGWSTEEEKTAFRALLKTLESQLPLPERSRLSSPPMAFRIFCATNGRVGKIMRLVRRAAEIAVLEDEPSLDLAILARAYVDRLMVDYPDRINPFKSDSEKLKPIPFDDYVPSLNGLPKVRAGNRHEKAAHLFRK